MHESLAEALHLRGTIGAVGHQRKIRKHAAIPATIALNAVARIEIAYIIALAGRAYEGAGTATKTGARKLPPLWMVEFFHQMLAIEAAQIQPAEGQFSGDGADRRLRFCNGIIVCVLQTID